MVKRMKEGDQLLLAKIEKEIWGIISVYFIIEEKDMCSVIGGFLCELILVEFLHFVADGGATLWGICGRILATKFMVFYSINFY